MSTINNPLNIKTRSHSSMGGGMIMDENKVPKSSIGMDKKIGGTTGLKSHRGALSDLTNNTHQTTGMATKTVQLSNNNIIMVCILIFYHHLIIKIIFINFPNFFFFFFPSISSFSPSCSLTNSLKSHNQQILEITLLQDQNQLLIMVQVYVIQH